MAVSGPGKSYRNAVSIFELTNMYPDEASAERWFEETRWANHKRHCGHCGSTDTYETPKRKPMPYRCRTCQTYFSVRTGTVLQDSRLPLRKWLFAVYLYVTSLKGVSSLKLHRDLHVTQKTAWYMLHRLRKAWDQGMFDQLPGPVEADETYVGGNKRNMHAYRRKQIHGIDHKTAVVGAKDRPTKQVRARAIGKAKAPKVHEFLENSIDPNALIYTDESKLYLKMQFPRESVNHSGGEFVRGDVHTNGIEGFWSMFKRAYVGTYHSMSKKHMQRYVDEFAGRQTFREQDTQAIMTGLVARMVGKRLTYLDLVAE